MRGFLGTGATLNADLNLLVQLTMGVALLVGMFLARRNRFTAHGICQATVMLLNLAMIGLIMWPSFRGVIPQLPAGLGERYYAVATAHAALGIVAELLGLYIVLVAATNLLPQWLRFQRWKLWMRTELALWWVVLLIGLGTYYVWYMGPQGKGAAGAGAPSAAYVTVKLTNFEFTPKEASVPVGATIEWVNDAGRHTVEADDGSFQSGTLLAGSRFEHTFKTAGTFGYHCGNHGDPGGKGMSGRIKVTPR